MNTVTLFRKLEHKTNDIDRLFQRFPFIKKYECSVRTFQESCQRSINAPYQISFNIFSDSSK